MLEPRLERIEDRLCVGMSLTMSLLENRTAELWRSFMPRREEIKKAARKDVISLQIFAPDYFQPFSPAKSFEKWALVEVTDQSDIPSGMRAFILKGGTYAVFDYKGMAGDPRVFQYIYSEWLPKSQFTLDDRPHFEILGEKYKNNDVNSEEEIWIPVVGSMKIAGA